MSSQEKKEETKSEEQSAKATPTIESTAAEAIEEDDEFEEFDPCRWDAHDEDAEDAQQWQVSANGLIDWKQIKWNRFVNEYKKYARFCF